MGIWEAMEKLSELVDDSDPDVSVLRFLLPVLPLLRLYRLYAVIALARVASFFFAFLFHGTPPSHQRHRYLTMLPGVSNVTSLGSGF